MIVLSVEGQRAEKKVLLEVSEKQIKDSGDPLRDAVQQTLNHASSSSSLHPSAVLSS